MNTYYKLLIILGFFIIPPNLLASEKISIKSLNAKIEIVMLDNSTFKRPSVEFKLYNDGINTTYNMQVSTTLGKLTAGGNTFNIALSTPISYGKIYIRYEKVGQTENILNFNKILFLFEAGDDIKIVIENGRAIFKGKGSEKMECAFELSKHTHVSQNQIARKNELLSQGNYIESLKQNQLNQDSLYNVRKDVLVNYRLKLSEEINNLMLADIWADYNSELLGGMFTGTFSFVKRIGSEHLNAVRAAYKNYLSKFEGTYLPEDILVQSFKYCDFLFWKEYAFKEAFVDKDSSSFLYRYHTINQNYKGVIRDKVMLINFYKSKIKTEEFGQVSDDAINRTMSPLYKSALKQLIDNRTGKAYNFELPDQIGKIHRLSDFKGKLVIIDFWYTGCSNCIYLAEALKPIVKELKIKTDIIFVSISVDKYRDSWLDSIDKEIYSSKDELNLWAQGTKSDIVVHYNIKSYPRMLVVSKDGKVITLNPPDPRIDAEKFKNFIVGNL